MKLLTRCLFLFILVLQRQFAAGQCATPNPPQCTFQAFDVLSPGNQEVQAFCVGRDVRFAQCPGRSVPLNFIRYGVKQGVNKDFYPTCDPGNPATFVYRPTAADAVAGFVTVSELSTEAASTPTYYMRTFPVYASPQPAFTVAPCPSGFVSVTVTDATYYSYEVQVGTGPLVSIGRIQPQTIPVPAGATTVTVVGHYNPPGLCDNANTQPIPPLAPVQPPVLSSLTLAGPLPGAATFAFSGLPAGYLYTLQVADTGPTGYHRVADVPAGTTILTLPNVAAGCYSVSRVDMCGNSPALSPPVCTLSLTGASAQNRNQLLFAPRVPGTTYTVSRDGRPLPVFNVLAGGGLEDADVQCRTRYTYVVTATQPDGARAVSNPVDITTVSSLAPPTPRLVASFNLNNVVELTALPATGVLPAGSMLHYRRLTRSQVPSDLGTAVITLHPQHDSTALALLRTDPPCYTVSLTDLCGNTSPESPATCPALLTAEAADPDGNTIALTWSDFTGPDPAQPVTYSLQRLAADGSLLSGPVAVSGGRYTDLAPPTDRQVARYRLQISGGGLPAGTFSYSNLASVTRRLQLTIPTAFTPNGDGLNDVLEVKGKYLSGYTFVVVDRNGQEVFRGTKRSDVWDGTVRGRLPTLGTYVWRFQEDDEDGQRFTATGTVTILK